MNLFEHCFINDVRMIVNVILINWCTIKIFVILYYFRLFVSYEGTVTQTGNMYYLNINFYWHSTIKLNGYIYRNALSLVEKFDMTDITKAFFPVFEIYSGAIISSCVLDIFRTEFQFVVQVSLETIIKSKLY